MTSIGFLFMAVCGTLLHLYVGDTTTRLYVGISLGFGVGAGLVVVGIAVWLWRNMP